MGEILAVFRSRIAQSCALIALLCGAAYQEIRRPSVVAEFDIWWHVSVGDWIMKNHSLPHNGILSQYETRPWSAYSWGFDLLVSWFHALGGMMGLLILLILVEVLITLAIYVVLIRASGSFWVAWGLSALGVWALYHNMPIRPVLFSVLFFTLELGLIMEAHRRGSIRPLYWLLPLFLVWANMHIQFVYGLILVGIIAAVRLSQALCDRAGWPWPRNGASELPLLPFLALGVGCVAVTMIGPYGIGLYSVIGGYAQSKFVYANITEMAALDFRTSAHYVQLLLTAAAFFALGRRSRDPYKIVVLVAATLYGYRMTRDSWFACLPALVAIASAFRNDEDEELSWRIPWLQVTGIATGAALVLSGVFASSGIPRASMQQAIETLFPVRAADFIRRERLPGPLYNNLNYGGFLSWYLPEYPVAIDGRTDLYGDEIEERFHRVLTLNADPARDPDLNQAQVILLQRGYPLCNYLLSDRQHKLVYQDHNSYVFIRTP